MIAYKFRSSANIQFALDILLNQRLYCAPWKELNDPMEGVFAFSYPSGRDADAQQLSADIGLAKADYRVCSLSANFQSHLLWAHYAGGFDGVAIEVELPDDDSNIRSIEYRGVFATVNLAARGDPDAHARRILFSKYDEWEYEEEIRILNRGPYYNLPNRPRRVIAGSRTNAALFDTLHLVCERLGIDFAKVGIGDEGIDADFVAPLDRARFRPRRRRA